MSVRILEDSETGYKCMYCSTSMWVFGSIFRKNEDVEDFIDWLKVDPRSISDRILEKKINLWRTLNDRITELNNG